MTTEQVEKAFTKAVDLATDATPKLPEGCIGPSLVQTLFQYLCSAEEDAPLCEAQLKEAA